MATGSPHLDEDDDGPLPSCYRHPGRETALSCIECERPICTDCAIAAAVGLKCPDCGRMPRSARAVIPTSRLVRAVAAGAVTSVVLGIAHQVANISFFGLIIAWFFGMAIGEVMRRAAGGFRDPLLARWAVIVTLGGFLLPLVPVLLSFGPRALQHASLIWIIVYAAVAAVAAYQRTE